MPIPPYNQLSEEQKGVIRKVSREEKGNIFVEGPPGSGKTVISLYTLKDIVTETNIKPLLLMYNHSLFGFLRVAIRDIGIYENITIATKDQYFWDLRKELGFNIPTEYRSYSDKYNYILRTLISLQLPVSYDITLVDEVQDINDLEWAVIKKISKRIITLGDFDQGIYESGLSHESIKNQGVYAKLSTIFRFHKNIAKLAQTFSRRKEKLEDKVNRVAQTQPQIHLVSKQQEYSKILEIIKAQQQNRKTVGIISPDRNKLAELHDFLNERNIKNFYFKDNKEFRTHDFNDITPILITCFSAKGLEFENVILFGFDTTCDLVDKLRKEKRLNDVIYVSITRTNTNLFIVKTPDTIKEINDIVIESSSITGQGPSVDDLFN
jgi:DNA helicase IV